MEGAAVGEVLESNDPEFRIGDIVLSMLGWREVFDAEPRALRRPPAPVASPEMYLGACGNPGHTAYIGLTDIILLEKGDVIFISAATGAVGLHCVPDRTATWSNGDRLGRRSGES